MVAAIIFISRLTFPHFAASLIIWALVDLILLFGALGKSQIMLQIWTGLTMIVFGVPFAYIGFWQVTVCSTMYAVILFFVVNLVRNFGQQPTRSIRSRPPLMNSQFNGDPLRGEILV